MNSPASPAPHCAVNLDVLAVMCCCHFPLLPVMSILRIDDPSGAARWFTLLRDTAPTKVSHLLHEESATAPVRRRPDRGAGISSGIIRTHFSVCRAPAPL